MMQVDVHEVEFTGNTTVSCDGTVPDSWLFPNRKLPELVIVKPTINNAQRSSAYKCNGAWQATSWVMS